MVRDLLLSALPLFRILVSSLQNSRWQEFKRVFRESLSAIGGQTGEHADSVLALPVPASAGSATMPPRLFQLASGYWISQAIYVAAKLGIADILKDAPKSAAEVALVTRADEGAISRLLRALCAVGVLLPNGEGRFSVAPMGRPLESGVPGSLRAMVITLGEIHYAAWAHLLHSVNTGTPGFPRAFGTRMFDYLQRDREAGNTFNHAMTDYAALSSCALLLSYDFSRIRSIVDVGGGCGKLLRNVLHMYPAMHGTLFDMPSVITAAQEELQTDPCRERCTLHPGSFLEFVPTGADAYLMSSVIHDWDDGQALRILTNCRSSMKKDGKVLLVEIVEREGQEASFSRLLDLNMLVMNGGRERTESEFRTLFDAAGLRMTRIIPTLSPLSVLEATCK